MDPLKEEEQKNSPDQENTKDENLEKGQKNLKKEKSFGEKLKNAAVTIGLVMAAVVLFSLGPIGIALGVLTLLFAAKKPITYLSKKAYKIVKQKITAKKRLKKNKSKTLQKDKTSSLQMDTASLKEMKTRPDSISKIDIIPTEKAKSTSNGLQPNSLNFQVFIVPSVKLSDMAMMRRKKPAVEKSSLSPNIKNVKPTL